MRNILPYYEEFLRMLESASTGDDACMCTHVEPAELLAKEFVVDIEPLKEGDFSQLPSPEDIEPLLNGNSRQLSRHEAGGVDSLTFIVVQPPLHEPQRFHNVVVMRSSQISEVAGDQNQTKLLFSTNNGVLLIHRSSKKESDNTFVGLWNDHLHVVTRFMNLVLSRERRMQTNSDDDDIWENKNDDVCNSRSFYNPDGSTRHSMLFLPRNSPPLYYETPCDVLVQTCLHVVPHVLPLYNTSGIVNDDEESMSTREILRRSIPGITCLDIEVLVGLPGITTYKHLNFSNSAAIMHPGIRASGVSSFAFTPWKYWGEILEYMLDKPFCCTTIAFLLESMGVSDRTDIGYLDVSYGGDMKRIFGNEDPDDFCYTVTHPDGSAFNLDQRLRVVSTGNVWNNDGMCHDMGNYDIHD